MSLLAWPALALLLSAGILLLLASWRRRPQKRDVGTLLIWRRVVAQSHEPVQTARRFDPLLWLLLAVVVVTAFGAARPAGLTTAPRPTVAVFIEPGLPGLETVRERAEVEAGNAELVYFTPAKTAPEWVERLNPGTIESELTQFYTRTKNADGLLLFLNQSDNVAGRVLPRVESRTDGIIFEVQSRGNELVVRASSGRNVEINGAEVAGKDTRDGVTTWRARIVSPPVEIHGANDQSVNLERRPFVVGVGATWRTDAHRALFAALETQSANGTPPDMWLGHDDNSPGVRINRGQTADLEGVEFSFDPRHPLFHELALPSFNWRRGGRVMTPEPGTRALLVAVKDGETVGDIVRQEGDVLVFAGDPFSDAPIAAGALLLDNAIGVVTGERPSEREHFAPAAPFELPGRRAALAEPFAPVEELNIEERASDQPREYSTWLLLASGLLMLCAVIATRRQLT